MVARTRDELLSIGREAVDHVAGTCILKAAEVAVGADSTDLPAYFFDFAVDFDRYRRPDFPVHARIMQRTWDALTERGDEHIPYITVFSQADWEKHRRA